MGACASSGGMFNNYAIVQGVDHVVPVDIYLPGCPPRPEMLMDAILKLHTSIYDEKLGPNREAVIKSVEEAAPILDELNIHAPDSPVAKEIGKMQKIGKFKRKRPKNHSTSGCFNQKRQCYFGIGYQFEKLSWHY
jgi:coenzyme F420-reducing hydrogenase gamma subunit